MCQDQKISEPFRSRNKDRVELMLRVWYEIQGDNIVNKSFHPVWPPEPHAGRG